MSDIPAFRQGANQLLSDIEEGNITDLDDVVEVLSDLMPLLDRRPPSHPKTRVKSQAFTAAIAHKVIAHKKRFPGQSHQQIADRFRLNQGRVSSALRGEIPKR